MPPRLCAPHDGVASSAGRDSELSYYRGVSLLDRLRNSADDGPLTRLVDLMIDDAMARPLGEVVDVQRWPRLLTQVAVAWSSSDAAEERLVQAVLDGVDLLDGLEGTVGDHLGLFPIVHRDRQAYSRVLPQMPSNRHRGQQRDTLNREYLEETFLMLDLPKKDSLEHRPSRKRSL